MLDIVRVAKIFHLCSVLAAVNTYMFEKDKGD